MGTEPAPSAWEAAEPTDQGCCTPQRKALEDQLCRGYAGVGARVVPKKLIKMTTDRLTDGYDEAGFRSRHPSKGG
jgi:hypothetical protein